MNTGESQDRRAVGSSFYRRRGIVVAEDLGELAGPTSGVFQLPLDLDASGRAQYDFGDAHDRRLAYRIVLTEAGRREDLAAWLEGGTLVAEWPELHLPPEVRAAWEREHPFRLEGCLEEARALAVKPNPAPGGVRPRRGSGPAPTR